MRFIDRTGTDPFFNLAAEEHLLRSSSEDTFMIWRNEPCVIIGKHQNYAREISHDFVKIHKLPVIRRISGGGTVYHDPGNLNFSFIRFRDHNNLIDFREFIQPVISFLRGLGLDAAFEGKSSITVSGLKVSGNSAHVHKKKVLHHGTLLFETDLAMLQSAISGNEESYKDKAVLSVRAEVANISALLEKKLSLNDFSLQFRDYILNHSGDHLPDKLSLTEQAEIEKLVNDKYRNPEWNFGYSPDYEYNKFWKNNDGEFSVRLTVSRGKIMASEIKGPEKFAGTIRKFSNQIIGSYHEKKSLEETFKKLIFAERNEVELVNQMLDHLF